jgi:saccharopine dehydrogenase-like NADP-dependent oxidoreductase
LLQKVLLKDVTCVIHTPGPYYSDEQSPTVLDAVIAAKIPVYVDVLDPIPFLEVSLAKNEEAIKSQTTALCAAGAFPGMSNVLGMEEAAATAKRLCTYKSKIKDIRFNYFTKGLGSSGTINLEITNVGFGDEMIQYENGKRKAFTDLTGKILGTVDFFITSDDTASTLPENKQRDNEEAKLRVSTQKVFSCPFPEAATVAKELSITGSSSAAMGTAPDIWNDLLGILVKIVPRQLLHKAIVMKHML